jgi:hypothetical protein
MRLNPSSLAVLLAVAVESHAQVPVTWEVVHEAPGENFQAPRRLVTTPDGCVITIESATTAAQTSAGIAAKFDENGDLQWRVVVPVQLAPASLWPRTAVDGAVDTNGTLYLAVDSSPAGRLLKVDPSGTVVFDVPLSAGSGGTFRAGHVVLDDQGQPIVAGTTDVGGQDYVELQKRDTNGALVWHERSFRGEVRGIERTSSGDVCTFGRYVSPTSWSIVSGLVTRHTTDGTPLWRRLVSTSAFINWDWSSSWLSPVQDLAVDAAENVTVIINGYQGINPWTNPLEFVVERLSPTGVSLTRVELVVPDHLHAAAVTVDAQGRSYVVGTSPLGGVGFPSVTVWCFAPGGPLQWTRGSSATVGLRSRALGVEVDADGHVLVTGWVEGSTARAVEFSLRSDGSERWAHLRAGASPQTDIFTEHDIAFGVHGNAFVIGSDGRTSTNSATRLVEYARGGAVGVSECGPAGTNSTGMPGLLAAVGSALLAANDVTLRAIALPPLTSVLFLASRAPGFVPGAGGGQGTLCLGGAIGRYVGPGQVRRCDSSGAATLRIQLDRLPQPTGLVTAVVGETWRFQAWYRDANPASTSNMTAALAIQVL